MSKLGDFEFETSKSPGDFETGPVKSPDKGPGEPGGEPKGWLWLVIVAVLAVIVALVFWWFTRSRPSEGPEAEPPAAEAPAAGPEIDAEPEEPLELPALDTSDGVVRDLVKVLSANPRLAAWLATDDLVRRFTVSIVNISEGVSPRSHLTFMEPPEPFTVRREGGRIVPSAKSQARYDAAADVVSSLDVEDTVELYRQLEPLIDGAFAELGYPGQEFDVVLVAALDHLLATPVIDPDTELVEAVAVYRFADPELEDLSEAQKQLLRTGPENVSKIQVTLRALRRELMRDGDG